MPTLPGDRVNRRVRARPWRRWVRACVGRTRAGIFTRLLRLAVAAATGVVTRAAASSGRIAAFVPPRPRGRHDLPRKCPRVRDHDQLPIRGPHGEAIGVMLFEDAKDVGDLLAVIWAGPAPADNDPLTDVGPGEPDREPVAHAGHDTVTGRRRSWRRGRCHTAAGRSSRRRRASRAGRTTWRSPR